ncbi:leukocyte immunoglobulin-like receptor subfamily A member 3 [Talpa occidentalis]|uniref:leukocyte immunoglobulin-like receptor subfamily A member 3 n=1 Tax=Talpa occidentalis TaxID=50954 RepID=UPI00188FF3F8|nr:leukocyte immunoglobulin-like receptor subfamily A member 3 [Talpa occidentalis]
MDIELVTSSASVCAARFCLSCQALWTHIVCTTGDMGGSTPTLMVLLCLGLCWGPRDKVQAGTLPKPAIWADPGPVVPVGSPVTLWCQGSQQAQVYHLYKERVSGAVETERPHSSSDRVGFHREHTSAHDAGRYHASSENSTSAFSERSDPLALVVTGAGTPPSLSAQPSPVVASGGNVTLACSSQNISGTFHLLKEGDSDPPRQRNSSFLQGRHQALFPVGPSSPSHGGTYRCYHNSYSYPLMWSAPSAPLRLQVTGAYGEPSLSAQPGPLVPSGHSLTLRCGSGAGFGRFALTKDEGRTGPQRLDGQHSPDFPLGPVARTHGGQYRCYGGHNLSHVWSAPSAPLDILIAGMDPKPSLSAQPGPTVSPGENVTLQCRSDAHSDTFYLSKEGSPASPQRLLLQDTAAPSQALFTFRAVTSAHGGTYRCYSSHSASPFLLSHPSDPLRLQVSDAWDAGYVRVLTGVSVGFILLLCLLLLLLLLLRQRRQSKRRKWADAAQTDTQPEEGVQLDPQQSMNSEDSQGVMYAQVNCRRRQQGVTASPYPLTEKLLDMKDRQTEEAATSDVPQEELTYAQLNCLTHRQGTAPIFSPSKESPAEPSVYAALAIH